VAYGALVEEHPPAVVLVPASADSAALVDPGTAEGRRSLARGGSLVAPALTLVNVVGYLLALVASRALDEDRYGELTALLGVLLVASVPALALQAVVARSVALRPAEEPRGPRERALLLRSLLAGVAVAVLAAAVGPVVAAFLHASVAGPLWLALGLLPLSVLYAAMGVLQGEERFGMLALLIAGQAVGKGVGLVPLAGTGGPAAVLAWLAGGTAVAAVIGVLLVARATGSLGSGPVSLLPGLRETGAAGLGLVALLALANLDLLLARNGLSGPDSGRYSAGTVCAKAAFWLPQVVAVVVFPRLSELDAGRAVLRRAVLVVASLGAVELVGSLLLGRLALEITFGQGYGSLGHVVPLFVLQGAALSVVQLLVYRAIATRDPVPVRLVLAALPVEAGLVLGLQLDRPVEVIAVAATVAVVTTLLLLARSGRA
jgi:O-antigen/teichoic acid export membrane protein